MHCGASLSEADDYLEHGNTCNSYKRMQITTVNSKTDFGNMFTDCESELCDNDSNKVEHRT